MASNNIELVKSMKKELSIWNINSFAEFYLQIFEKYKSDYEYALDRFRKIRAKFEQELKKNKKLRVIPSQANYIMCEIVGEINSTTLSIVLLDKYNIFIKDLHNKAGIRGDKYFRVAIRTENENEQLIKALNQEIY